MKKLAIYLLVFWFVVSTAVTIGTWIFAQEAAPYSAFSSQATTFYWTDKSNRRWECTLRQTSYVYSTSPYPFTYWWCSGRGIPTITPYPTGQYPSYEHP